MSWSLVSSRSPKNIEYLQAGSSNSRRERERRRRFALESGIIPGNPVSFPRLGEGASPDEGPQVPSDASQSDTDEPAWEPGSTLPSRLGLPRCAAWSPLLAIASSQPGIERIFRNIMRIVAFATSIIVYAPRVLAPHGRVTLAPHRHCPDQKVRQPRVLHACGGAKRFG